MGSVVGAVLSIPRPGEPFTAIGLLGPSCRIGDYPREVPVNQSIDLCIYISNNLGQPALLQARIKISYSGSIPTNTSPLDAPVVLNITVFLPDSHNVTRRFSVTPLYTGQNIVVVGELWRRDLDTGVWVYTGQYVFIRVNVTTVSL